MRIALGFLVTLAPVVGAWWVTSPQAVGGYGNEITVEVPVGDTVFVDAGVSQRARTLTSAAAASSR